MVVSHRSWISEDEEGEEVDVRGAPKQHSRAALGGINFPGATAFLDYHIPISLTIVRVILRRRAGIVVRYRLRAKAGGKAA